MRRPVDPWHDHWDNEGQYNEHSSCWIRVVQPWAGASWGFQFIPRVGMEVVVAFLGGDTDHPLVLGSVNNALTPVSQALPLLQTKSGIRTQSTPGGGGYNELLFEDRAGHEELAVTAQRNLHELTRNDRITHIGHDEERAVTRNRTVTIGGDELESIGGDKSDLVGGTHRQIVGGRREKRVGGDDIANVGGALIESAGETMRSAERDYRVRAGGSLHLFAGGDAGGGGGGRIDSYSTGDHLLGAGAVLRLVAHEAIELVCGSSTIRMTQDAIEIRAEKAATLRGGSVALAGSTTIGGKVVKIASAGASLVLDGDAHLDGALVKLNCGGSGEGNAGTPVPPDEARKLSLRLLDSFEPYANKKTRVSAGSKHLMTSTAPDGLVEVDIPKDAMSAVVTVWADDFPDGPTRTWDVKIAELAPASEVVGAQQRLRNLGYYEGSDSGALDDPTRSAIRSFQEDMRIASATGELDRRTVIALETVHGY